MSGKIGFEMSRTDGRSVDASFSLYAFEFSQG